MVIALRFLVLIAAAFLCTNARPAFAQNRPLPAASPSVVYMAHDPAAIQHYRTNPAVVRAMVNQLVVAVTGRPTVAEAWASLVNPNDRVGIKISAAGGELFTTHHEVVAAIVDGLVAAGHARGSIVVWDRTIAGASAAGYGARDGFQLLGITPRDGYDPNAVFSAPLMGNLIWGDLKYIPQRGQSPLLSDKENTDNESHFSRILTTGVTKVINVPVMSNNEATGIAGCLYNMTIPNVDNWRRFMQGRGFGGASIAELYADPAIGRKVVLNLMDGLVAEYAGGPAAAPNFALHHATLLASRDPVAIDALALRRIDQWRANAGLPTKQQLGIHVEAAAQLGLGNADPERIVLRTLSR